MYDAAQIKVQTKVAKFYQIAYLIPKTLNKQAFPINPKLLRTCF